MSNPASAHAASRQARALLARTLPGSRRGTVAAHLARAERIGDAIWRRWQVGPYQWQLKHLRWYLATQTKSHSTSTRYRHWLPRLQGPWIRPTGKAGALGNGRPTLRPSRPR